MEPKFLAVFTSFSVRTGIPGGISSLDAWRFSVRAKIPGKFPVLLRSVFRPEPEFLAVFSVSTEIPDINYQFECEEFLGQNQCFLD